MSAPYRDAPPRLACPRCGELLEETAIGAHDCLRCGGTWLAQHAIDAAFDGARWPVGSSLWWRSQLACPECARRGRNEVMPALAVGDVVVDRCADHGVWLDEGELERVLRDDQPRDIRLRQLLARERRPRVAASTLVPAMAEPPLDPRRDHADTLRRLEAAEQRRAVLRDELRTLEARIAGERERLCALEDAIAVHASPLEDD